MSRYYLGIDIGTTYVKSALLNLDERRLEEIQRFPTPMAEDVTGEVYEIPMERLTSLLRRDIERRDRETPLEGIVI